MEKTAGSQVPLPREEEQSKEFEELLLNIPREKFDATTYFYQYQGFWYLPGFIQGVIAFQKHFRAQDNDVILISYPKSGTTWLKALAFAIVNRSRHALENSPLLSSNPHSLVPFLEIIFHLNMDSESPVLVDLPTSTPRIMQTHVPYTSLPASIVDSNCRIVYICRNPLDQFISYWHFLVSTLQRQQKEVTITFNETFEMFCRGVQLYGPFWDHVLGYRKASVEQPHKILFLKYEDLKEDINVHVKRIAEFLGCPFSAEEEWRSDRRNIQVV